MRAHIWTAVLVIALAVTARSTAGPVVVAGGSSQSQQATVFPDVAIVVVHRLEQGLRQSLPEHAVAE